ncbi:AMP-binding protein [Gordonia oryzae]|uniref:AMP-binding protein n=1 Tax=Gordonia oryzae TaxID=2487349 RepID=UPI001FE5D3E1|nr:AMP-binding protein [Gordonia oryzae]
MTAQANIHDSIDAAVRRRAREHADDIAVVDPYRHLTWSDLDAAADRLAASLSVQGVGRGDRVAWLGPNVAAYQRRAPGPSPQGSAVGSCVDGEGANMDSDDNTSGDGPSGDNPGVPDRHNSGLPTDQTGASESSPAPRKLPILRTTLTPFVGAFGAMLGGVYLLAQLWSTCDINQFPLVSTIGLTMYAPVSYMIGLVTLFVISGALMRVSNPVYLVSMTLALLVSVWLFVTFSFSQYNSYPELSPACPEGVPPWWPSLIPLVLF